MPLLFQGHLGQLEEFLSRSREQQVAFVQLLDHMINRETNMDVLIRHDDFCMYMVFFTNDNACSLTYGELPFPTQILK
jgi:hypothetical protein